MAAAPFGGTGMDTRYVALRCDECGNPRAGCHAVDCAIESRDWTWFEETHYTHGDVMATLAAIGCDLATLNRASAVLRGLRPKSQA